MPTVHLDIKGKVQGVFFRATAKKVAENYNLTGWIKNKSNGNVEAIVTGEKNRVEMFIDWCKKGPENARVTEVSITDEEEIVFNNFFVKG
jgi:acylphosphatase